jgi:tRNA threonylcarbamoyladenosine biosynthesis protein TsaB
VTPLILGVDTTGEYGSLALVRGSETLEEVPLHAPAGYAQVLYGALEALLTRQSVSLPEIHCFAAASGPGSFTGVRVALACVKGLAEGLGRPAVAVSNLEALARFGTQPFRSPILDARRGEIYAAVYDAAGRLVMPETVATLSTWLSALPRGVEFVATDWPEGIPVTPRVTAPRQLAAMVARVAATREWLDPAALDANYVRRADAELFWKEY